MIIILLFNIISVEQKVKIKKLFKIKLGYIFANIIFIYLLQEIYIKVYIYISILLKLLINKKFYKTFINSTFCVHINLVIINKVYLIAN